VLRVPLSSVGLVALVWYTYLFDYSIPLMQQGHWLVVCTTLSWVFSRVCVFLATFVTHFWMRDPAMLTLHHVGSPALVRTPDVGVSHLATLHAELVSRMHCE
jgi:hypothetical protein